MARCVTPTVGDRRWRDPEVEVPEPRHDVLVAWCDDPEDEDVVPAIGYRDEGGWRFSDDGTHIPHVVAWRALPEMPRVVAVACPECNGMGSVPAEECFACGGSGGGTEPALRCPWCGGTGRAQPGERARCERCRGSGVVHVPDLGGEA